MSLPAGAPVLPAVTVLVPPPSTTQPAARHARTAPSVAAANGHASTAHTHEHDMGHGRLAQLQPISWPIAIAIGGMHLLALAAPFTFTWSGVVVLVVLWWLTLGLGVCLCYHRLLTHRSFKTFKWVEYAISALACTSWQGSPAHWVGTHRLHHKHSDGEDDPHTPHHGFSWAHATWMLRKDPPGFDPRGAAKDLMRDPVHAWLDRHHAWTVVILAAILAAGGYAVGGWFTAASWVVWGVALRITLGYHCTWLVNSAAHTWGYQTHNTGDDSRNNWWVAMLSFGEGWHNNHHAEQRAAAHGRAWWEFDVTYLTIRAMKAIGLAWDVVPARRPVGGDVIADRPHDDTGN